MNKIIDYIVNRLSEASTWRGIILLLTALGIKLQPDQIGAITTLGLALVGVINVFKKDALSKDALKLLIFIPALLCLTSCETSVTTHPDGSTTKTTRIDAGGIAAGTAAADTVGRFVIDFNSGK